MSCRLEPLHAIRTLACGAMRVLTAVIEIATLTVFHSGQDLPCRRAIALELIRNDDARHIGEALEQLAKELLGCLLVPPALPQNIEDVVILIDGPPQVMALTVNCEEYFIQMPFIPELRATAPQAIGIILPKLPTPLTDGFMGHSNTTLEQELLHVAVAQGETIVKPDSVADDFTGKAVVLVARGGGQRGDI